MSTIQSSAEHLTLNADGSSKDIKFQANGVEKASISSAGAFTSTTIDATKLTGNLPAISGASLTGLPADSTKLSLSGGTMTGALNASNTANTAEIKVGTQTAKDFLGYSGVQFDDRGFIGAYPNDSLGVFYNTYHSSGSKAIETGTACNVQLLNDGIRFQTAPSVSADASQTFINALNIKTDGQMDVAERNVTGANCAVIRTAGDGDNAGGVGSSGNGIAVATLGNGTNADDWAYVADVGYGQVLSSRFRGTHIGGISNWSTTTTFNTSSDYRLKENEVPMSGAITRLKELKPYRFNWKIEPDEEVDGFFAHEVTPVVPVAVTGEKDAVHPAILWNENDVMYSESDQEVKDGHKTTKDVKISRDLEKDLPEGVSFGDVRTPEKMRTQTIDHSKLVPLLTGALQEAIAKIEALEVRVKALEA